MLKGGIYITVAVFLFIGFLYMFVVDVDTSDLITNNQVKDTKKITNSQYFMYELVANFILFTEYP